MSRLLVGVTGGIAAYKSVSCVRLAIAAGHSVRVVQTADAQRFVGAATFEGITGAPVLTSEWERDPARGAFPGDPAPGHAPISHLELVAGADAYVIVPATANTLAKLAHGLADNLLTSAALAAPGPVLVAPAMNHLMWRHPATRANVALLRERGVTVLDPAQGALASRGEWGEGRLPEPPEILAAVEELLARPRAPVAGPLDGLKVLVTAGGTREPIDSVRYVGNRSSGRMGWALASAAARRGADVTVVAANVALERDPAVTYREVSTAAQMHDACLAEFPGADVLLMAAAVADFRPVAAAATKLKKDQGVPVLEFEPTDDVLAGLAAARRPAQTLVGFAAEHGTGAVLYGRAKLKRKALDLIVVNDISQEGIGFDSPDNEVTLLAADGAERAVTRAGKDEVAEAILDEVLRLRAHAPVRA